MNRPLAIITDDDLIARLRRAVNYGLNNAEHSMFDELVWRFNQLRKEATNDRH